MSLETVGVEVVGLEFWVQSRGVDVGCQLQECQSVGAGTKKSVAPSSGYYGVNQGVPLTRPGEVQEGAAICKRYRTTEW